MKDHEKGVRVQKAVVDQDGESRFVDEPVPYVGAEGPLRGSEPVLGVGLSFRWRPGDFDMPPHVPLENNDGGGVDYLHNQEDEYGVSFFERILVHA